MCYENNGSLKINNIAVVNWRGVPQSSDLGSMQIQAVWKANMSWHFSDNVYIDKDCLANNIPHN